MKMKPKQLRAFIAVAEAHSFTRGAETFGCSQSALSMSVEKLERELGTTLFSRSVRGAELTEAGRHFLEYAAPLMQEWDAARARLDEALSGELHGGLAVAAGGALMNYWLPDIVRRFRRKHPKVELKLVPESKAESLRGLRLGRLDLALRSSSGIDHTYETAPLLESRRVIIAPRGTGLPVRPRMEHLANQAFVLPRRGASSRTILEGLFEQEGLAIRVALEGGGWELLKRYVHAGLGLAVVPELTLTSHDRKHLEVRRPGNLLQEDRFVLVTAREHAPSRAAEEFAASCEERAEFERRGKVAK